MTRVFFLLLAAIIYSMTMYVVHVLIDNAGADVGAAARVVYRLQEDTSFIFKINQDRVDHSLDENSPEEQRLRNDTYVCGPKFIVYLTSTAVFTIMRAAWQGADPLSALFLTNLLFFFGSSALIYIMLRLGGQFSSRYMYFFAPVLFLSMPTIYFIVFFPTYLFALTFLMLSGMYLVIRSYGKSTYSMPFLLAGGFAFGLTMGAGSQAIMCIYAGFIFTGLLAFYKRHLISSLLLVAAGTISAVALSELAFQVNGASFVKWFLLHMHENVYDNHLKEPFPFIPFVYFRVLYALLPLTLVAFVGGLCLFPSWGKSASVEGKCLLLSLIIVLVTLSLLPNTPLFRILFPFFILIQASIFLMVLNLKSKIARYTIICLLLIEVAMTLPSAFFIQTGKTENKSPIFQFEDERAIVKFFNY